MQGRKLTPRASQDPGNLEELLGGRRCIEQAAQPWESQRPPAFTCKATGESEQSTAKSAEKSMEKSPTLRAESCIEKKKKSQWQDEWGKDSRAQITMGRLIAGRSKSRSGFTGLVGHKSPVLGSRGAVAPLMGRNMLERTGLHTINLLS